MSAIASVTEVELSKDLQVRSTLHVLLQHPEGMQYMPCFGIQEGMSTACLVCPFDDFEQPLLELQFHVIQLIAAQ